MSILNTTIVPRLYHSEAILLQDGRVLVSGSDPNPDGGPFPEEFRVEVYVPPYLATGQKQPSFNISQTDWTYGGQFQITNVVVHQNAGTRISLTAGMCPDVHCIFEIILTWHSLTAVGSTHGNSMVC